MWGRATAGLLINVVVFSFCLVDLVVMILTESVTEEEEEEGEEEEEKEEEEEEEEENTLCYIMFPVADF